MIERLSDFESKIEQAKLAIADIELLREVDCQKTRSLIDDLLESQAKLRDDVCKFLSVPELGEFSSLASIIEAVNKSEKLNAAKKELAKWHCILDQLGTDLANCEYRHAAKRIREAGVAIIAFGRAALESIKADHGCQRILLPWFERWGESVIDIKKNTADLTFAEWPDIAEPLKEVFSCISDVHLLEPMIIEGSSGGSLSVRSLESKLTTPEMTIPVPEADTIDIEAAKSRGIAVRAATVETLLQSPSTPGR